MKREETKKPKPTTEQTTKKSPTIPKGRSIGCSILIYTFVFVSGVVVATILPDLAGHHFNQPYGKKYGAIVEQVFKDVPKHLTRLSETVVLLSRDLVDRVWDFKALVEQRITNMNKKTDEKIKSTGTQRPST